MTFENLSHHTKLKNYTILLLILYTYNKKIMYFDVFLMVNLLSETIVLILKILPD